ncbi:MAG: cadherin domain-containing protein [Gammaproteobacteria bacterium]|nr:cadherin domain-containing protein [Gammaproteobacteria bacterium]
MITALRKRSFLWLIVAVVTLVGGCDVASVNVANLGNHPPQFTSPGTISIKEKSTTIMKVEAIDPDGDVVYYGITGGEDASHFTLNQDTGQLDFRVAHDYDNPADINHDNVYLVNIGVSDGKIVVHLDIAVTVQKIPNLPPVITAPANFSYEELNSTNPQIMRIVLVAASDPEHAPLAFTLSGTDLFGINGQLFSIDTHNGRIILNFFPDYEAPIDFDQNNVYELEVSVSDGVNTVHKAITLSVVDVSETAPLFASGTNNFLVSENHIEIGAVTATDVDAEAWDSVSYSLTGGADQALFKINRATGELSFIAKPDYENPINASVSTSPNVYEVIVTATDGRNPATQTVTVTVTDLFEFAIADGGMKKLDFSWAAYAGADHYGLYFDKGDGSLPVTVDGNIPVASLGYSVTIPVTYKVNWLKASYYMQALDVMGTPISISDPAPIAPLMLDVIGYVKASNAGTMDRFGLRVVVSGDGQTIAVGARGESSAAVGINGAEDDDCALASPVNCAPDSGAVYVYKKSGVTWAQQAYLKASNTGTADWFGEALALSADGRTLAVGAYLEDSAAMGINGAQGGDCTTSGVNCSLNSGAVYVFVSDGTVWTQQAYIKASNTGAEDRFGYSIALSVDGGILAVGAPGEASGDVADQTNNYAPFAGAVYVFARDVSAVWSQQGYLKASNVTDSMRFGNRVALSGVDGLTLAVAAPNESGPSQGINVSEVNDCKALAPVACVSNSGAVYVFVNISGSWNQQAYIKSTNASAGDYFGDSLSLSGAGDRLAVGADFEDSAATVVDGNQISDCNQATPVNCASSSGAVYIFERTGGGWSQNFYIKPSNAAAGARFGSSLQLRIDGAQLVIGSPGESGATRGLDGDQIYNCAPGVEVNCVLGSGAVYLFSWTGATWEQASYLKSSNSDKDDSFGYAVALSDDGNTLAAGAYLEDSVATGIDPMTPDGRLDNTAPSAGAVYIY